VVLYYSKTFPTMRVYCLVSCACACIAFLHIPAFRKQPNRPAVPITDTTDLPTTTRGNIAKSKTKIRTSPSDPSKSTLWRHARGKPSRRDKAANQQYLTPCEENVLLEYVLRMSECGYPLPVKFLRSLALVIARQRSPLSKSLPPPMVSDRQARTGYNRHAAFKARRVKALDWTRHGYVGMWFRSRVLVLGLEIDSSSVIQT
jgi:hypothetical protein